MEIKNLVIDTKKQIEQCEADIKSAEEQLPLTKEPLETLTTHLYKLKGQVTQKWLDKCYKYLEKKTDDRIVMILESLIGILRGVEKAEPKAVQTSLKKAETLQNSLTKVQWLKLSSDQYKKMLTTATSELAVSADLAKEDANGAIESTGKDFPKDIADFKLFYQLLIVGCKLGMAHQAQNELQCIITNGKSTIRHSKNQLIGAEKREKLLLKFIPSFALDKVTLVVCGNSSQDSLNGLQMANTQILKYLGGQEQAPPAESFDFNQLAACEEVNLQSIDREVDQCRQQKEAQSLAEQKIEEKNVEKQLDEKKDAEEQKEENKIEIKKDEVQNQEEEKKDQVEIKKDEVEIKKDEVET